MKSQEIYKIDWSPEGILKTVIYPVAVAFGSTLNYIDIKQNIMTAALIAIALDTIFGIAKAKKLGIKPSSKEGWKGLIGKLLGLILLGGSAAILKLMGLDTSVFVNGLLFILIVYELYSAVANFYTARTGVKVKEYDAISIVLKLLLDKLKSIGEALVKKNKNKE